MALGAIQLEAVVGASFMRRRRDVDLGLERNADLVFWLFHVVPLATLISVTIGVASLYLGGVSRQRTPATPSDGRFGP